VILSISVLAGTPSFFVDVAALLVAGAVIAYLGNRIGFVPIVGFLLAGVVIGPNALGLVRDPALVDAAAEVGVILLLFTIGIEFSLEKLGRIRRLILVGGGLQVVLATLLTLALVVLFGRDWRAGLFTGFLVALSSTAIVLKLIADKGETQSEQGQISLALLIFQDLAIIAMVLTVPILGGAGGSSLEIFRALGKAAVLIVAVLWIARRIMPRVLESVARTCSPELFLLTVIAICFGTAYLTSLAGVSLSLGAFLAGLIVSESSFSEHALGEILPLQILFSATFFVSVGMLLDPVFLLSHLPLVLGVLLLVVAVKALTTGASVLALGYKLPLAASTGLLLAQVGEFSFVLERAGREVSLYPAGLAESGSQAFIAATVLLMVFTPALARLGDRVGARVEGRQQETAQTEAEDAPATPMFESLRNHVIVAGFGTAARRLVRVFEQAGLPFVITTLSPAGADEAERDGFPVLRGDSSRMRTLQLVGAERAKMLVIADDDPAMARRIAAVARTLNPTMRIIVRTRHLSETGPLVEVGTDVVITEEFESIVQVFGEVLRGYRINPAEVEGYEETIRRGGYRVLEVRGRGGPALRPCDLDDECLDTRTVTVRSGAPAVGRSIGELDLDREGIQVTAVRTDFGDELEGEPGIVLSPGDALVLRGTPEAFAAAAALFRVPSAGRADDLVPEPALAGAAALASPTNGRTAGAAAAGVVEGLRPRAFASRYPIDLEKIYELTPTPRAAAACRHLDRTAPVTPSAHGCEECLAIGDAWVHLRLCMTCGHVGCCDSSKNKHATKHYHATSHPIIRSLEPGENWAWCYEDEVTI
jgi:CPA2 family monovalent cation:H+ antiporter-2